MGEMTIPASMRYHCERCGCDWVRRTEDKPLRCAKCRSPYWETPRGKLPMGRPPKPLYTRRFMGTLATFLRGPESRCRHAGLRRAVQRLQSDVRRFPQWAHHRQGRRHRKPAVVAYGLSGRAGQLLVIVKALQQAKAAAANA